MAKSLVLACFAAATLLSSLALAVPIDVEQLDDPVSSGPANTPLTIPYVLSARDELDALLNVGPGSTPLTIPYVLSAPGELHDPVNAGPTSTPLTIPYLLQSPPTDLADLNAADRSLGAVVPSVQVPEPEPIFLLAIALLGMASMRLFSRRTAQEE